LGKNCLAQIGCTDPQAINYDSNAIVNDGSCEYPTTNYSLQEKAILSNLVLESSGLAFFDNQLWTHNDGGNEDKLYQLDTLTGEVLKTVVVANSENEDWEDLAEDDTHVYIGDFGNNDGDRTNLRIYKFPKSQIPTGVVTAELIEFNFEDQTVFTPNNNNHNYDCEAFFFWNDSLHLFSKNWVDQKTRHYILPSVPGNYEAKLVESIEAQGFITGGDINDDGVIGLIGYNPSGVNIMWLFFDYKGTKFFSGNKRKISLGLALDNSQTEALVFKENGYGYISSESFANLDAKLLSFQIDQWTNGLINSVPNIEGNELPFEIFPNPFVDDVNILLQKDGEFEISLFTASGIFIKKETRDGVGKWDLNFEKKDLTPGVYFLTIKNNKNLWVTKLLKLKR